MAEVANLRVARKARDRAAKKAEADQNAAKFGRSKGEKQLEAAEADKARRNLDGHERE
jgi:phage protein D